MGGLQVRTYLVISLSLGAKIMSKRTSSTSRLKMRRSPLQREIAAANIATLDSCPHRYLAGAWSQPPGILGGSHFSRGLRAIRAMSTKSWKNVRANTATFVAQMSGVEPGGYQMISAQWVVWECEGLFRNVWQLLWGNWFSQPWRIMGVAPLSLKKINGLWIIKGHFALTFGPLMSQSTSQQRTEISSKDENTSRLASRLSTSALMEKSLSTYAPMPPGSWTCQSKLGRCTCTFWVRFVNLWGIAIKQHRSSIGKCKRHRWSQKERAGSQNCDRGAYPPTTGPKNHCKCTSGCRMFGMPLHAEHPSMFHQTEP